MGFHFDFDPHAVEWNDETERFQRRYEAIELANEASWYFDTSLRRDSFDVIFSVHSAGAPRNPASALSYQAMTTLAIPSPRRILGGNMDMSPGSGPRELGPDTVTQNARENIQRLCVDAGIHPHQLRILRALGRKCDEYPLTPLAVDTLSSGTPNTFMLLVASDFLYSYDPEVVLAACPADCPLLLATAETPKGTISILIHYPWRGVAYNYIEQTDDCFTQLDIDRSTLRMYLSAGAHAESFTYKRPVDPRLEYPNHPELFQNVHQQDAVWHFGIDTPKVVYDGILALPGIEPWMLYADTSDTGSRRSGYSSHNRAFNEDPNNNTRDLACIVRHKSLQ